MAIYNPDMQPDPGEWLALDEHERMRLVELHHRAARMEIPNVSVHAAIHAIVENQIAGENAPVVRAMAGLRSQGLSRHDAVHAIGSVCIEYLHAAQSSSDDECPDGAQTRYDAAVERLTATSWQNRYGS